MSDLAHAKPDIRGANVKYPDAHSLHNLSVFWHVSQGHGERSQQASVGGGGLTYYS